MRLARVRSQMLLAMGLPVVASCWSAQSSTAPVPTTAPQVALPPPPTKVADFDPDRCAKDTIPETICGTRPDNAMVCGARGDTVESLVDSTLHVTPARRANYSDFVFDLGATQGYQDRAEANGDPEEAASTCCFSRCTPITVAAQVAALTPPPGYHLDEQCFPPPPGGTSAPEASNAACPAGVELDSAMRPYSNGTEESCCYATLAPDRRVIKGRAIRIDGEPAAAPVARRHASGDALALSGDALALSGDALALSDDTFALSGDPGRGSNALSGDTGQPISTSSTPSLSAWSGADVRPVVDEAVRAKLAAAWLDAARMEHASIAAFSILSLRLMALGAPPALIARTHAAALDEIEHARLAFALASAYAGEPLEPAPFADVARAVPSCDLAALAVETLIDGCWNETVAALEAEVAAECAEDPAVTAVLAKIAVDEARHAELAFAIVAWCARRDPSVIPQLRAAIASDAKPGEIVRGADLEMHGVLGDARLDELRASVLREVVEPCVAALA